MNLTKYSHVIFDFDRTIATLEIDWSGWHDYLKAAAQQIGHQIQLDRGGPGAHAQINQAVRTGGNELRLELLRANAKYELSHFRQLIPISQTIDLIENLQSHQQAHIVSSSSREILSRALPQLKLTQTFATIVAREDTPFIKPDPAPFALIYDGVTQLDQYVMIGDMPTDRAFAQAAGIDYLDETELG